MKLQVVFRRDNVDSSDDERIIDLKASKSGEVAVGREQLCDSVLETQRRYVNVMN